MLHNQKAIWPAIVLATLTGACAPNGTSEENGQNELVGYGGLVLGSTFEEATLVASPRLFNPYGLSECIQDMPISGCFLSPRDELDTFQRIDGIPYGLQLEFNRFGALTDITLKFTRRRTYDDDLNPVSATITRSECLDIVDRTVDWVTGEYGNLAGNRPKNPKTQAAATAGGNAYWMQDSTDGSGFVATGEAPMQNGRSVGIFAHFLMLDGEPDCDLSVSFEESEEIERRAMESSTGE